MDDVWLNVFSRLPPSSLPRLQSVCRRWHTLVTQALRKRRSFDAEKDFPGCLERPEHFKYIIEKHSSGLQDVVIRVSAKSERFLVCASEYHLNRLCIKAITNTATRLRSLRIERMNLTIGAVEQLASLAPTLQELSLINCAFSCSSPDINLLAQNTIKRLFQTCTQLTTFEISMKGLSFEYFELTDSVLSHLPDSVRHLNISAGKSLQIKNLDFLARKSLESFVLQRSFISAADIKWLLPMAPTLVSLDITSSINILDCSTLSQLTNLRELWIGHIREGIDDSALISITAGCRKLELLSIEDLPLLTEVSLCRLGTLKLLRRLTASGVRGFNDKCCQALEDCPKLEYLELNFCRNITTAGVLNLLRLPLLEHFELLGVSAFSPALLSTVRQPKTLICDNIPISHHLPLPPIPIPA